MTKLFRNPCAIINSDLYRFGEADMGKVSNLERDTVARVSNGVFEFIGIPERFLRKVEDDKCFKCSSSECAMVKLVQTRRQGRKTEWEDQDEVEEKGNQNELMKTQKWAIRVKRNFQVNSGRCLEDPNYTCKTRITLPKEEYEVALSKHYLFCQLFRFLGWVCMLDLARAR